MEIRLGDIQFVVDPDDGRLLQLSHGHRDFIAPTTGGTLFRLFPGTPERLTEVLPVDDEVGFRLESIGPDRVQLHYQTGGKGAPGRLRVVIDIQLVEEPECLRMQLQVENRRERPVPQVLFPDLRGLRPMAGSAETVLRLPQDELRPFEQLERQAATEAFMRHGAWKFYRYPYFDFNMKWVNLGSDDYGLSLHSEDRSSDYQGLYVERSVPDRELLDLSWVHYPYIEPGETWESPVFVLYPHSGDWSTGIQPYRQFAREAFSTADSARHVQTGLGFRSVFLTHLYNTDPFYRFDDLPDLAKEAADHGLRELNVWFWCDYFQAPEPLRKGLGDWNDFAAAAEACRSLDVNLSPFISINLHQMDGDPSVYLLGSGGQRIFDNWTYDLDFVPPFQPEAFGDGIAAYTCPASEQWQHLYREEVDRLRQAGLNSFSYDQFVVYGLCYNQAHQHRPAEPMADLMEVTRDLRRSARQADERATVSAEFMTDVSQEVLDYAWEWTYGPGQQPEGQYGSSFAGTPLRLALPFQMAHPRGRLSCITGGDPTITSQALAQGMLLNVMPGVGRDRLDEWPALSEQLKRLSPLKERFWRFYEQGEFEGRQGLNSSGAEAFLYRLGEERLVTVANPTDDEVRMELEIDEEAAPEAVSRVLCLGSHTPEQEQSWDRGRWQESLAPYEVRMYRIVGD